MKGFNRESNSAASQSISLGSTKHHLLQLVKGVLVGGLTLGGYELWRRWWEGEVPSANGQTADIVTAQPKAIKQNLISRDIANSFTASSDKDSVASIITNPDVEQLSLLPEQPPLQGDTTINHPTSLADELGIRYPTHKTYIPERMKKKFRDKPRYHTLAAPVLTKAIPEQHMEVGQLNRLTIRGADFFRGTIQVLGITQANGGLLPAWLNGGSALLSVYNPPGAVVSVVGHIAFMAGDGLQILNVTDFSNPTLLGSYNDIQGWNSQQISIVGNIAFVVGLQEGLKILNVANLSNPKLLGTYAWPNACAISVVKNTAFVAYEDGSGLKVLNVTNLSNPTLLASYDSGSYILGISVVGNIAFVANYNFGLQILNVAKPSNLTLLSTYNPPGLTCSGVSVVGNTAFVLGGSELQILNVANLLKPILLGSAGYVGLGISVVENIAYLFTNNEGLVILDVANPSNPTLLGSFHAPGIGAIFSVSVIGDIAFTLSNGGLQLLKLSELTLSATPTTTEVGQISLLLWASNALGETVTTPFDILVNESPQQVQTALTDHQLFPGDKLSLQINAKNLFLDPKGGWLVLSAEQISSGSLPSWLNFAMTPTVLGAYTTPDSVVGISVVDNTAFLACNSLGLLILNVANPSNPTLWGSYPIPGFVYAVSVAGDTAFVTCESLGLLILNVANPSRPILLGSYYPLSVVSYSAVFSVVNNIVFVAEYSPSRLQILNAANPSNITLISSYNIPGSDANEIVVVSDTAFIADYIAGLQILNVANLSNPILVGSYDTPGAAYGISVIGNTVYLADNTAGLQILNVANLSNPTLISSYKTPGEVAQGISVVGNSAFVTNDGFGFFGLQILNVANTSNPIFLGQYVYDTGYYVAAPYVYDVSVVGSTVYLATSSGLQIVDLNSWTFSGTPAAADAGNYPIRVTATDYLGATVSSTFTIRVEGPPVVSGSIATQYAQANQLWNYFFSAGLFVDPNFNPLTYSATLSSGTTLPAWLVFNGPSYQFSGTPTVSDRGSYVLRLEANDGLGGKAATDFTLVVNVPPSVLSPIPNQNAQVLKSYNFTIPADTFVDIDGNRLIYSVTQSSSLPLPSWLTFINITLKGIPQVNDAGQLNLLVLADDGHGGQASTAFSLNINIPPSVNQIFPVQQGLIGQPLSFVLPSNLFSGSDPNSVLTATLANGSPLPGWLTFDSASRRFSGTPVHGSVGTLLIKVTDTDSTGASVSEVIEIVIPNQPPVTVNSIPDTQASVWRSFELIVPSTTFADPDGNTLTYQAQLQGNLSLPHWLNFEANTRLFSGKPGLLDTSDLTVDVIANDGEAQASTQFRIAMNLSTAFQDIATYYSASGGGLIVLSLLARVLRWYQMKQVHKALTKIAKTETITSESTDEKTSDDISLEQLKISLENLQKIVRVRDTEKLEGYTSSYSNAAKVYSQKNPDVSLMTLGNLREVVKEICQEIESRNLRKSLYSDTLSWADSLHQLLQLIVEVETTQGRPILKADKEDLMAIISKASRYTDVKKPAGVALKQRLSLAKEALVCMDDSDLLIDNLRCRDNEMLVEIIKTMLVPPYGAVRLLYQMGNIPGGWNPWYATIIQMCHLSERAITDDATLTKLQTIVKQQSDWRVIYEGVGLLGKVARQTHNEKLRQQAIEDGSDEKVAGLRYYQKFNSFWVQCCTGPGCKNHSGWIRNRAEIEIEKTTQTSRTPIVKIQNLNPGVAIEMAQPSLTII